jgi:hypothetical protein
LPSSPISRLKILRRILFAGVSLILTVIIAEFVLRGVNPFGMSYYRDTSRYINEAIALLPADAITPTSRIFQNRPDVHLALETFDFATDNLGLRGPAPGSGATANSLSNSDAYRILFLGDSVTLAWGVDDGQSWIRKLERRALAKDGRPLVCLNAGHLQYNTTQEADLFRAVGPALQPDAVIVTFITNDVIDYPFEAFTRLMEQIDAQKSATGFGAKMDLYQAQLTAWFWAIRGVLEYRRLVGEESEPGAPTISIGELPGYAENWERCRLGFESILAQASELGIPLIVLDQGKPRVPDVQKWCKDNQVAWYDFGFSDAEWERGLRVSQADAHANELGNQIQFEKSKAALIDAGILSDTQVSALTGLETKR